MFRTSIPKEDVRNLPLIRFDGTVHVVDNLEKLSEAIEKLEKEELLGFDTETKPTFNKGEYNETALIQLSTMSDAYLIRVKELGIPNTLKNLLENKGILKIGISITDDLKELKHHRSFEPGGFIDLNQVAKEFGITQIGMKSLTGIFLKSRVSKSQQTSNWEANELSEPQQFYAATDAWVCIKIYQMLEQKGYL